MMREHDLGGGGEGDERGGMKEGVSLKESHGSKLGLFGET